MSTESQLLSYIYDAPDDEAHRAVYADWLLEQGDIRGEFIQLQLKDALSDAEEKRATELLAAYRTALLGPIAPMVEAGSEIFERGLLHACLVRRPLSGSIDRFLKLPAWSTLRRVWGEVELLLSLQPSLRHLEWIGPLDPVYLLERLAAQRSEEAIFRVPALHLRCGQPRPDFGMPTNLGPWSLEIAQRLGALEAFPRLSALRVSLKENFEKKSALHPSEFLPLLNGPLGQALTQLSIQHHELPPFDSTSEIAEQPTLLEWRELLSKSSLKTFELQPCLGWRFRLSERQLKIDWYTDCATADLDLLGVMVPSSFEIDELIVEHHGVLLAHHEAQIRRVLGDRVSLGFETSREKAAPSAS